MERPALRHPAVLLAVDAAVAASAAWLSVVPLGGLVDRYPCHAPLGQSCQRPLLTSEEAMDRETVALGPGLRGPVARLLDPLGDLVGEVGRNGTADRANLRKVVQALDDLVARVRERRRGSEDDFVTAGAVVTVVRHAVRTLGPLCDDTADPRA